MKNLDINVNFGKLNLDPKGEKELSELGKHNLFEQYLSQALSTKDNGRGVKGIAGRILVRILDKLDTARQSQSLIIPLEEAEFELIQSAFNDDETGWAPAQWRLVAQYQEMIKKCAFVVKGE